MPANAANKNVTYTSNNPAIAPVDSYGQVKGKKVRMATITCEAQDGSGVTATCKVTVREKPKGAAGLQAITGIPAGADGVGLFIGLFFRLLGFGLFLEDIGFSAADTLKYIGELFGRADNQGLSVFQLVNLIDQIINNVKSLFNTFSKILSDFWIMLLPKKAEDPIVVDGWLKLYAKPTASGGRKVPIPEKNSTYWAAFEDESPLGPLVLDRAAFIAKQKGSPVQVFDGGFGSRIDENGRYWIAVGPKVLEPNISNNAATGYSNYHWNVKIDIVVEDNKTGQTYYIRCVPGDIKAATYSNGVYQTGYDFPDGKTYHSENTDSSAVEFMSPSNIPNVNAFENTFRRKYSTSYKAVRFIIYDN